MIYGLDENGLSRLKMRFDERVEDLMPVIVVVNGTSSSTYLVRRNVKIINAKSIVDDAVNDKTIVTL